MGTETSPTLSENGRTTICVRKRKLTEDRRRQNREAQRRYRERRKAVRGPLEHNSDYQDIGNGANIASPRELTYVSSQSSFRFPECLLQPFDESIVSHPNFFEDMLLLDSASTPQEHPVPISNPSPPLPSPYKNHLTVQKLSFYAARVQNALHLGLPVFLAQKEDDISPWYWHTQFALLISQDSFPDLTCTLESTDSPYNFTVQRPVRRRPCFIMSETVIPDLSPTALQRSHPHGMYLDMIPFPIFRDRAITLLSMDPPAFSEAELKRDIENEGLMVWGAGHGSTSRAASLVRDKRNWECARWFYRKWKLLVEGSGLDEQSRWWRTMRGEEDSEDE